MTEKANPSPLGAQSAEHAKYLVEEIDWAQLSGQLAESLAKMLDADVLGQPRSALARSYWRSMSAVLSAINVSMVAGEQAPPTVAGAIRALAGVTHHLGAGCIDEHISLVTDGGRGTTLDELMQVQAAVAYIEACRRGWISDSRPVRTVVDSFGGISRQCVYGWIKENPVDEHRLEFFAEDPVTEQPGAAIEEQMREAGAAYRRRVTSTESEKVSIARRRRASVAAPAEQVMLTLRDELRANAIRLGVVTTP